MNIVASGEKPSTSFGASATGWCLGRATIISLNTVTYFWFMQTVGVPAGATKKGFEGISRVFGLISSFYLVPPPPTGRNPAVMAKDNNSKIDKKT